MTVHKLDALGNIDYEGTQIGPDGRRVPKSEINPNGAPVYPPPGVDYGVWVREREAADEDRRRQEVATASSEPAGS